MAKQNYTVGMLITGDAKGGIKATQLTKNGLKDLSVQHKKTSKSTKDLTSKTGSMIGKLGKVTGAVGLVTATLGSMGAMMRTKTITEMKVMADTLNLSTQTLSEWSTAGEKVEVSGEKMADIFKDIQDKIGDLAATGGGEAKDIFEKLNLDINEFVGLSADEQLLKIGSALDNVASHSEKIFYLEALANDASRLLPLLENNAFGLKTAQEEARLLGTSINDIDAEMIAVAGREMQRMGDISTGLGNTITAAVAPALGIVNTSVMDIVVSFGGWETIVDTTIELIIKGIGFVLDILTPLQVTLLTVQLGWQQIGQAATSAMSASAQVTADVINFVLTPFQALLWGIADGWGKILIGLGEFSGSSEMTQLGESLQGFAHDVSQFSVSADDVTAADKAMTKSIIGTKNAIVLAKGATRGNDLVNWWKDTTKAAESSAAATVKVKEAQRDLGNVIASNKGASTSELSEDYEKLIKQVDGFSGAWASAGNVIVDTFGSIGQQMEKLFVSQDKYAEALKYNNAEQAKDGSNLKQLKAEEIKLNYASTQAQLNSYGSIAGAAADMFGEKTKAAKAFHAIEQIMAVASLAMSVEKMVMGTTETGVHIANETTKQGANALTAITSAFAAPFPVNFIAGAAMIGIISSLLGGSFGSSGSAPMSAEMRQETQGTGTVLGSSDKSASLNNSLERSEALQLDQYAVLREMNTSLHDLNSNITHLAASFAGNFGKFDEKSYGGQLGTSGQLNGDIGGLASFALGGVGGFIDSMTFGLIGKIIGGFKSTKKSLVDSGISIVSQTMGDIIETGLVQAQQYFDTKTVKKKYWGASKKTSYNTEYQDIDEQLEHEMALIFGSIGDSINLAVDVLGFELTNNLDNFLIDLPKISFKDLSGDEIQAELEAMFSSQSDLMATYLVPSLQDFQEVGEGLYETLIRLAQEQAVFNSVLEITGNTLASVDANQAIEVTQAIIGFAGGIENLQSAAGTFFNEFFSEAEQFEYMQKQLNAQFNALGVVVPKTKEGFKDLVSALDPLNEADQRLYAQLLLLSGQSAEYYDALEKQSEAINNFVGSIQNELDQLDMSPLQIQLANLQKEFDGYRDEASELGVSTALLERLFNVKQQQIIDDELASIAESTKKNMDAIASAFGSLTTTMDNNILSILRNMDGFNESDYQNSEIDSITNAINGGSITEKVAYSGDLQSAIMSLYKAELLALNDTRDVAQQLHDEQLANIEEKYSLEMDIYNALSDAIASLKSSAESLLLSDLSTLTNEQRLAEAKSQYDNVLSRANTGDIDAMNLLAQTGQSYLGEAQKFYASGGDYSQIFDSVYNNLNSLGQQNTVVPVREQIPIVPPEIRDHNQQVQKLQQDTINELNAVRVALDQQIQLTNEANEKADELKAEVIKASRVTERQMDELQDSNLRRA